jgi:hypothetical protein
MSSCPPLDCSGGIYLELIFIGTVVGTLIFQARPQSNPPTCPSCEVQNGRKRNKSSIVPFPVNSFGRNEYQNET